MQPPRCQIHDEPLVRGAFHTLWCPRGAYFVNEDGKLVAGHYVMPWVTPLKVREFGRPL